LRVLNASPFRPYNLRLGGGAPLKLVGTDGGLLPHRVDTDEVMIGPGERAEVVVDFREHRGEALELRSTMPAAGATAPRTDPVVAPLMQFRVDGKRVRDTSRVPAKLRPLPSWVHKLSDQPQRAWIFGLGLDPAGRTAWTINGQTFDPERVDAQPTVDSLETWLFVNAGPTNTSHYIHIHDVPFYVLSRNGQPPTGAETGLKDTFRLDPGEVLVAGTKFSDHVGVFMLHCHMLNHEDHGMMTTFEVVKDGTTPPAMRPDRLIEQTLRDPLHRRSAQQVVAAASAGRPAPDSMLHLVRSTAMCSLDHEALRS
jgi:FtsP/CotA-like multicopper oxidase with cupredoxin domain